MSDLPKHFHGMRLGSFERAQLRAWAEREGWTRQKSIDRAFNGNMMPANLVAPGIPIENWSGNGKCVCVFCGYVTVTTNIHRHCPELPADDEAISGVYCYTHKEAHRFNGKWAMHRTIAMVAVT